MQFDIPTFIRCCVCVPLRLGLLIWGYASLILLGIILVPLFEEWKYLVFYYLYSTEILIIYTFLLFLAFGNIAFSILLIVAAHKRSSRLMIIYNKCAFVAAILECISLLLYVVYNVYGHGLRLFYGGPIRDTAFTVLFLGIAGVGMQTYILAIVRSEIIKLDSNREFEFQNIVAEPEKDDREPEAVVVDDQKNEESIEKVEEPTE
ncbi:hypothetical protein O0L34_g13886 [Tuta absoluta]|nr:hypothetical protein O0L34_g13886 [Tuta absoluta]